MAGGSHTSAGGAGPTAPTIAAQVWAWAGRSLDNILNIITGVWSHGNRTLTGPDNITDDNLPVNNTLIDVAVSTRATQADIINDATPFEGAAIGRIDLGVQEIEDHIHNISRAFQYTADGANLTTGVTLTAGAPGFGAWTLIETAANIQTAFPAPYIRYDPNRAIMRNASSPKIWEIEYGYGPDAAHVTALGRDPVETDASVTGRRNATDARTKRGLINATDNLYARVRGSTNGGTIDIIIWVHPYTTNGP